MRSTKLTCAQIRNCEKVVALWQDEKNFVERFSPINQVRLLHNEERSILADTPSMGAVRNTWGDTFVTRWLATHLIELNEYCGVKEKMSINQINQCAKILISQYGYLKPQEFMIFFLKFKAGEYGRFYGSIDPMVISDAMREFMTYRNKTIDKVMRELERQEQVERKATASQLAISYEEYIRRKESERAAKEPR